MRFGGLLAVNNVSLELREREIVSLIGPNGAGKTTVFNCLTGLLQAHRRHLFCCATSTSEGLPGQQIARMGVVRTFQHVRLFREMTVIENLLVAQHQQLKTGLFSGLLKTPAFRRGAERSAGQDRHLAGAHRPAGACQPVRPATWPTATSVGWRLPAAW
ncbi:ATP-binding cassette domain-containing protein [Klebsiella pneumoniae subsp. pneumoniae]|nr:ATP-binding cassette domain-containing protein [Klebsiella pneumoniae subsp. pneumoniae]